MEARIFGNNSGMSIVIGVILITLIVIVSSVVAYAVVTTYRLEEPVIADIEIQSTNISNNQEVVLIHRGGDSFDVSDISIVISVNGVTLKNNLFDLPVTGTPYGFTHALGGVLWGTPTNQSHDNIWDPGDTGDFNIAKNNNTKLIPGDMVRVVVVHKPSGTVISAPECRV